MHEIHQDRFIEARARALTSQFIIIQLLCITDEQMINAYCSLYRTGENIIKRLEGAVDIINVQHNIITYHHTGWVFREFESNLEG